METDGQRLLTPVDLNSDGVVKLAAGSGEQIVLPFSGIGVPWGIVVDTAGDVFVGRYDYRQTISTSGNYDNNAIGFANTTGNAVAGSGSQAYMAVALTGTNTLVSTTTNEATPIGWA